MRILRGKKALFYVAQPHHIRLWKPLIEKLEKEGLETIYVTSHAYFPFEVSLSLIGKNPIYLEDFWKEEDRETEDNIYSFLSHKLFEIHKKENSFNFFPPQMISHTLRVLIREAILFPRLLEIIKVDAIFALHELNRWSKLLAYLSFKKGIPFITLQEGAFYTKPGKAFSLTFHTEYSTVNLIWGKQTFDILVSNGNAPEKLLIVGNTHFDYLANFKNKRKKFRNLIYKKLNLKEKKKPLVIIISGFIPMKGSFIRYFLDNFEPEEDINYVVKLHPTIKRSSFEDLKNKYERENLKIVHDFPTYELLAASDVAVSVGISTLSFEALAFGKPLLEVRFFDDQWMYFSGYEVAIPTSISKLNSDLKDAIAGKKKINKEKLDQWLSYVFYKLDGKASERAVKGIAFILKEKEFYSSYVPPRFKINETEEGICYNYIIVEGNVPFLLQSIKQILKIMNEKDSINLVFYKDVETQIETVLSKLEVNEIRKLQIHSFPDNSDKKLSILFNFGLERTNKKKVVIFKEGVVPLKPFTIPDEEKIFGAIAIDEANRIKHLGVVFDHNNVVYKLYENLNLSLVPLKGREVDGLDYFLCGNIETFEKVGKFDERIHDFYSFIDYTLTAKDAGIKSYLSSEIFIGYFGNLLFSNIDAYSHLQFYTKWRGKTEFTLNKYLKEDNVDLAHLYSLQP